MPLRSVRAMKSTDCCALSAMLWALLVEPEAYPPCIPRCRGGRVRPNGGGGGGGEGERRECVRVDTGQGRGGW